MKFRGTIKGKDGLIDAFRRLDHAVSRRVMVEALKSAAEPMRAEAATLAPRSKGKGPHLADNIAIAETRFGTAGEIGSADTVAVAIGPSHRPSDFFYGFFQEFGTANHPAHPFMRPAFDRERKTVMRRVADEIRTAMKQRSKPRG